MEHRAAAEEIYVPARSAKTCVRRLERWTVASTFLAAAALGGTTCLLPTATAVGDEPKPATNAIQWTGIPKVDLEHPMLHRGVVFGPEGKPLPGASVYAASSIELLELASDEKVSVKNLGSVRAITDAEGRFEFAAEDLTWVTPAGERKRWETLLVAAKEGVVSGWIQTYGDDRGFRSHWHPDSSKAVAVHTRTPASLTGQVFLEGVGPLASARINLTGLMAPRYYDLDRHIVEEEIEPLGLFSGIDYEDALYRPALLPGVSLEAVTDKDGRFELPGLPDGYITQVEITHPAAETDDPRIAVRAIEPVYRKPFMNQGEPTLTLYGSGGTIVLRTGALLQGQVTSNEWGNRKNAVGIIVAQANHNSPDGMSGQQFQTDAEGRFQVTGLPNQPAGYELAFIGSFAAPFRSHRERIVPGEDARVELTPAIPYRLTLTDQEGNPIDREVSSIDVQKVPGMVYRDVKHTFNVAERVAPGIYQGIVPKGPAAVLVKRGKKTDRPVAVNPKAFFEPGRMDWTLEEERYAYGDAWQIAGAGMKETDRLAVNTNPLYAQLELAAVVFTNTHREKDVLELKAVVYSDPPVEVTLIDEAGQPVDKARIERKLDRFNADELPATFSVHGLHPERAEFMIFRQDERGLIGTLLTTWTSEAVRVVMRPAATLRGRFVDRSGNLNFDFGARVISEGVLPDTFVAGRVHNPTEKPGERKAEFQLIIPPDVEVRGEFVRKTHDHLTRPGVGKAFGPLKLKPGEVLDLGNITTP